LINPLNCGTKASNGQFPATKSNLNQKKTMKKKEAFKSLHPTLNPMQLRAAYQLSEIDGWHVEGKTASKDGMTLRLLENGNALK
jgi:hypothetical protein